MDIGAEIDRQNDIIPKITQETEKNTKKMKDVTQKLQQKL